MRTESLTDTGSYDSSLLYPPPAAPDLPQPASGWRPFEPGFGETARRSVQEQQDEERKSHPAGGVEAARAELLVSLAEAPIPDWPRLDWQDRLRQLDLDDRGAARELKELEDTASDYRTWRTAAYLVQEIDQLNGTASRPSSSGGDLKAERERWDNERAAYGETARRLRQLRRDVEALGKKLKRTS